MRGDRTSNEWFLVLYLSNSFLQSCFQPFVCIWRSFYHLQ